MENRFFSPLILFSTCLALLVIVLGAYTRLTDAGLGCPDWPGCYGQLTVPDTADPALFPGQVVEPAKAWAEMVHRYVAGTLGLLIFAISTITLASRKISLTQKCVAGGLIGLVVFQAALGMWTVTLKLLPVVVMGHLLGGLTILSVLWFLFMRNSSFLNKEHRYPEIKPWAILGFFLLVLQIALGGWTSANYSALVCPDFPYCHGDLLPAMNFKEGFDLLMPIGANFEGGVLDHPARVAIQMMHRFGALCTTLVLGFITWRLFNSKNKFYRNFGFAIGTILTVQVCLGVLNVVWLLPLANAVLHNAVAAILLLAMLSLLYNLMKKYDS